MYIKEALNLINLNPMTCDPQPYDTKINRTTWLNWTLGKSLCQCVTKYSIPANYSTRNYQRIQTYDVSTPNMKKKERRNYMRQPNQGHKIKRDNGAKLIFLKDPN